MISNMNPQSKRRICSERKNLTQFKIFVGKNYIKVSLLLVLTDGESTHV